MNNWSDWMKLPDPTKGERFAAPSGPGCYELRNGLELIEIGESGNVAKRIRSILPKEYGGKGHRSNVQLQTLVAEQRADIEYRTIAMDTKSDAKVLKTELKERSIYQF